MPEFVCKELHVRCLLLQHARRTRTDCGLNAVRKACEQPGQHDFQFDVIVRHIDGSADPLFQGGELKGETVAAPDFFVDLENFSILRSNAAEPRFQAARGLILAELVRNGNNEWLSQCRASEPAIRRARL